MNGTSQISTPCLPAATLPDGRFLMAVHVGAPRLPDVEGMWPPGNSAGLILLHRVLLHALQNAGVDPVKTGAVGEFNDGMFIFQVNDLEPVLPALKEELAQIHLLRNSQIAYYDYKGEWVCVWPSSATRMGWLLDLDRYEPGSQERSQNVAQQIANLLSRQSVNGQSPDIPSRGAKGP